MLRNIAINIKLYIGIQIVGTFIAGTNNRVSDRISFVLNHCSIPFGFLLNTHFVIVLPTGTGDFNTNIIVVISRLSPKYNKSKLLLCIMCELFLLVVCFERTIIDIKSNQSLSCLCIVRYLRVGIIH